MQETTLQLDNLGNNVPDGNKYYEKQIAPCADLSLSGAHLKWYNLYPTDAPITPDQVDTTRAFICEEEVAGRLKFEGELGFVILHRAGDMLLLLITTWRNTNEMWEAVYVKRADDSGVYKPMNFDNSTQRGTYCVWELGAVWHERNAWVRYLASERDQAAKLGYINDQFEGRV